MPPPKPSKCCFTKSPTQQVAAVYIPKQPQHCTQLGPCPAELIYNALICAKHQCSDCPLLPAMRTHTNNYRRITLCPVLMGLSDKANPGLVPQSCWSTVSSATSAFKSKLHSSSGKAFSHACCSRRHARCSSASLRCVSCEGWKASFKKRVMDALPAQPPETAANRSKALTSDTKATEQAAPLPMQEVLNADSISWTRMDIHRPLLFTLTRRATVRAGTAEVKGKSETKNLRQPRAWRESKKLRRLLNTSSAFLRKPHVQWASQKLSRAKGL
mmetsp:Transcript_26766/g.67327  ORF Transcript_26766/g.67327 Transcript_26766/m.67327 type:complete len:272 (+) Transcript_26766:133-948(+)